MIRKKAAWLVLVLLIVATAAFVSGFAQPTQAAGFNCRFVSCACPDCLENEHLEVPPGQCCPVCVPN
ncbi:MAG TPA: hypothetical protein VJS92_10805 [Candidatus Polarisedimenticolaceae bacterium]|nr:hypothetical protein [Candidatus Polarisedimenticolaceae bacterium]